MSTPPNAGSTLRELTIRSVILGGLITLIFTAANVYLGLKVGLTFATSIPAAVISMAVLKRFADHTITENNIVQTIASAAGTLSAIIFVLPGLVMVGWWQGFPYWTTVGICAIGGILGVMYSIPLRRALVTGSDLPYPEGVAAAEVLRVGDDHGQAEENRRGLKVIIVGSVASAGYTLLTALKAVAGGLSTAFRVGSGGTMVGTSMSMALIGVGHLVGVSVGVAMIVGLLISYGILLPYFTAGTLDGVEDLADAVGGVFSHDVRFIGAGTMAVAAVWTLVKIIGPIIRGIKDAMVSSRARHDGQTLALTERDIPFPIVVGVILASMIPVGLLLWSFLHNTDISHHTTLLLTLSILFVLAIGLIVASVCGYMAGLIGSSNSPISGVGIIVVIAAALLIKYATGEGAETGASLVAYTLFTATVVFGVATISNDNLQDLKTGELVGATPWKQQVALIFGVIFGSVIIPPILEVMYTGFGFVGMEGAGPDALAAPQAALLSSVVQGIFGGSLDWNLLGLGALIGVGIIIIDELLSRTTRFSLPPLAVGMGMYLPVSLTIMIPMGAFLGMFYNRWAEQQRNTETAKRMGVLLATGLIVGESLFGVLNAGIIAASGKAEPLGIFPDSFAGVANWLGGIVFVVVILGCYRWLQSRESDRADSQREAAQA